MSIPTIDFGLFIAYVLPGLVTLYGLTFVVERANNLFRRPDAAPTLGAALMIMLLALLLGRVVSAVRAAVMQPTFAMSIPLVDCAGAPQFGGVQAAGIDYMRLVDRDRRELFKLITDSEFRPYQFAGNTALALLFCTGCWIAGLQGRERYAPRTLLRTLALLAIIVFLYGGARVSHYRYARALAALNGEELRVVDGEGRPCASLGVR